jgi:hypothetical protein
LYPARIFTALFEESYQTADGISEIGYLYRVILIENIDDGLVGAWIGVVTIHTKYSCQ